MDGDHKCFQIEEGNDLLGIDGIKIKSDSRSGTYDEQFICEICTFKNASVKTLRSHYNNNHREDYNIQFWQCGKGIQSLSFIWQKFTTVAFS